MGPVQSTRVEGGTLPNTPPYAVEGRLRREGARFIMDDFSGKVGDSDLRGNVTYLTGGERRFFRANLRSKRLDFDDLGPLVGAPPKTGPGETASAKQQAKAAQLAASSRILPHEKFSTEHWNEMDADVHLVVDAGSRDGANVVRRVEDDERVAELARMLAGLGESDTARAHARELLETAAAEPRHR